MHFLVDSTIPSYDTNSQCCSPAVCTWLSLPTGSPLSSQLILGAGEPLTRHSSCMSPPSFTIWFLDSFTITGSSITKKHASDTTNCHIKYEILFFPHILANFQKIRVGLSNHYRMCVCVSVCLHVPPPITFEPIGGFSRNLVGRYCHSRWPWSHIF
jgi:hypothetical protein